MITIKVNDKIIDELPSDLCDCPEDAMWHRALGEYFWAGVKAGRLTTTDADIIIIYEDEEL